MSFISHMNGGESKSLMLVPEACASINSNNNKYVNAIQTGGSGQMKQIVLLAFMVTLAASAQAEGISGAQSEVMKKLISGYAEKAKQEAAKSKEKPASAGEFSAEVGRKFYLRTRNWEGDEVPACAACHTDDPRQQGKHAATKKPIKPLAPSANPERFTSASKIEKNFATHCQEIYTRDCDAAEKGHFLTYLLSVK